MTGDKQKRRRGRPTIGDRKVLSVTLPPNEWEKIQSIVDAGHAESFVDYFRQLHEMYQDQMLNGR